MSVNLSFRKTVSILFLIGLVLIPAGRSTAGQGGGGRAGLAEAAPEGATTSFLPAIVSRSPWLNPFGTETSERLLQGSTLLNGAEGLQLGWVRLHSRISWRLLQPTEGSSIQWSLLAQTENELRALKAAGLTPILIISDFPAWAVEIVRNDRQPATCGPVSAAKFQAFAQFMRAVVARFKTPEFNVHHWELGNEPDVDPNKVNPDSVYGCWGRIGDPFYGGSHYGEMLKVVAPAIKAEDTRASVWIGGLLLDKPLETNPANGHPELFLKGILEAGAAPYFEAVPYHWYASFMPARQDYDLGVGTDWEAWGGGTVGKARYLRQLMQAYGVTKPLYLDEAGLGLQNQAPTAQFRQMQADYLGRSFVRGLNERVSGFFWYTLDGPGWRYTGLLEPNGTPLPAYTAYQQLSAQLQKARLIGPVDYGHEIEAYAFQRKNQQIQVLWTIADTSLQVAVPQAKFAAAYAWDGTAIPLSPVNGFFQVPVHFSPVYVVLNP